MKTYKFIIPNEDAWAITDTTIVIVAESKILAKKMLKENGYDVKKTSEVIELKQGVHIIQEAFTE